MLELHYPTVTKTILERQYPGKPTLKAAFGNGNGAIFENSSKLRASLFVTSRWPIRPDKQTTKFYGGEYWTKMELNKFISNRVMHYIVPCGDIPSKTTNFSVDRYTIPDTSCYCIGHAPTSYRMLLYGTWCCQIVINARR